MYGTNVHFHFQILTDATPKGRAQSHFESGISTNVKLKYLCCFQIGHSPPSAMSRL